jgi:hypothetical protein
MLFLRMCAARIDENVADGIFFSYLKGNDTTPIYRMFALF